MTASELFENFFDDAAIFPPGLAPLDEAVSNHLRRNDHQVAPLIGPLILPVEHINTAGKYAGDASLHVSSVVTDQELEELRNFLSPDSPVKNVSISTAEVKLTSEPGDDGWKDRLIRLRSEHPELKIWVELPYASITDGILTWMKRQGLRLKFRTGGIRSELFPTPQELVRVIYLAVQNDVPFKLTAGLHRAMRYTDLKTGFAHFGFLNIAAATKSLLNGLSESEALEVLNSQDRTRIKSVATESNNWRDVFVSFGTCSVVEPLETLTELGLYQSEDIPAV